MNFQKELDTKNKTGTQIINDFVQIIETLTCEHEIRKNGYPYCSFTDKFCVGSEHGCFQLKSKLAQEKKEGTTMENNNIPTVPTTAYGTIEFTEHFDKVGEIFELLNKVLYEAHRKNVDLENLIHKLKEENKEIKSIKRKCTHRCTGYQIMSNSYSTETKTVDSLSHYLSQMVDTIENPNLHNGDKKIAEYDKENPLTYIYFKFHTKNVWYKIKSNIFKLLDKITELEIDNKRLKEGNRWLLKNIEDLKQQYSKINKHFFNNCLVNNKPPNKKPSK